MVRSQPDHWYILNRRQRARHLTHSRPPITFTTYAPPRLNSHRPYRLQGRRGGGTGEAVIDVVDWALRLAPEELMQAAGISTDDVVTAARALVTP